MNKDALFIDYLSESKTMFSKPVFQQKGASIQQFLKRYQHMEGFDLFLCVLGNAFIGRITRLCFVFTSGIKCPSFLMFLDTCLRCFDEDVVLNCDYSKTRINKEFVVTEHHRIVCVRNVLTRIRFAKNHPIYNEKDSEKWKLAPTIIILEDIPTDLIVLNRHFVKIPIKHQKLNIRHIRIDYTEMLEDYIKECGKKTPLGNQIGTLDILIQTFDP